ncbi:calcium-activated potassium channel subunit alpha-1-like [Mustelus asterias]
MYLRRIVDAVTEVSEKMGLTLNIQETKVLNEQAPYIHVHSPIKSNESTRVVLHTLQTVDLCFNAFFLFYFGLRFIAAEDKLQFWYELNSIVDFFTIPPVIVALYFHKDCIGLRFMRSLRLLQLPEILQYLRILKRTTKIKLASLLSVFLGTWFTAAGFIHTIENSGDPWLDHPNEQTLTYWQCVYLLMVTMSTVGYGDLTAKTTVGQVFMVFFIIMGLALFASHVPEIIEIIGSHRKYIGKYRRLTGKKYVIVCGHITLNSLHDFLKDFICKEREEISTDIVVMENFNPGLELQALFKRHTTQMEFFQGSVLNPSDLDRIRPDIADACLILADKNCLNPEAEDSTNIMRAIAVKQYCPEIRVIAQVLQYHSKAYLQNLPSWDMKNRDSVICLSELKMGFIAQNCIVPGFSTLLANLFVKKFKEELKTGTWLDIYQEGLNQELFTEYLSDSFVGMSFSSVCELCYIRLNLLLIAIQYRSDTEEISILINPDRSVLIQENTLGFFIAKKRTLVNRANIYCNDCHSEITDPRRIQKCSCKQTLDPEVQYYALMRSRSLGVLPEQSITQEKLNSSVSAFQCESLIAEQQFGFLFEPGISPDMRPRGLGCVLKPVEWDWNLQSSDAELTVLPTEPRLRKLSSKMSCYAFKLKILRLQVIDHLIGVISLLQDCDGGTGICHTKGMWWLLVGGNSVRKIDIALCSKDQYWNVTAIHTGGNFPFCSSDWRFSRAPNSPVSRQRERGVNGRIEEITNKEKVKLDSTGMFHWCPPKGINQVTLNRALASRLRLSKHVIVCIFSEPHCPGIGLRNFVMPLRASSFAYDELKSIVFVGSLKYIEQEWSTISNFPNVFILPGSPLCRADLKAVNIGSCDMAVIISSNRTSVQEKTLEDKECILATLNIKAMVFEETMDSSNIFSIVFSGEETLNVKIPSFENNHYYRIPIITALVHDSNVHFLDQEDRDDPETEFYLTQPYASGCVFASNILNSLMCTTYFNDNILMLIRTLVTGGGSPELEEQLADEDALRGSIHAQDKVVYRNRCKLARITLCDERFAEFVDHGTYGDLFCKALNVYGILCFGIFRLQDPQKQSKKRFVITNPSPLFELDMTDFIMCTVPFCDTQTISVSTYCPKNYSSKFIPFHTLTRSNSRRFTKVQHNRYDSSNDEQKSNEAKQTTATSKSTDESLLAFSKIKLKKKEQGTIDQVKERLRPGDWIHLKEKHKSVESTLADQEKERFKTIEETIAGHSKEGLKHDEEPTSALPKKVSKSGEETIPGQPKEEPKSGEKPIPRQPKEEPKSGEETIPGQPKEEPKSGEKPIPRQPKEEPKSGEKPIPRQPKEEPKSGEETKAGQPKEEPKSGEKPIPRQPKEEPKSGEKPIPRQPKEEPKSGEETIAGQPKEEPKSGEKPIPRQPKEEPKSGEKPIPRQPKEEPKSGEKPIPRQPKEEPKSGEETKAGQPKEEPKSGEKPIPRQPKEEPKSGEKPIPRQPKEEPKSVEETIAGQPKEEPKSGEETIPRQPKEEPKSGEETIAGQPKEEPKSGEETIPRQPKEEPKSGEELIAGKSMEETKS